MNGAINSHSRSVTSLAYRLVRRTYCCRVVSVQAIVHSIESSQIRGNHNWLKSLISFWGSLLEKVIKRVAREAPGVSFELLSLDDDPDELLHSGDVDFLILPDVFMSAKHPKATLFEETLVCVGCPENERLRGKLSLERFMSMGHVAAMFGRSLKPSVEQWLLLQHGFKRRVDIAVPSFNLIPSLLSGTNRIATLPSRLVRHFEPVVPLQIVDHPLPPLRFTEALQWPSLHDSDPGNAWMREIMFQEASRMQALPENCREP
ncbi:LysR substrate-binding domain-containing protein [Rhizobium leguminosarum]|uniref:LysR substrate-binding domain-containing protein n=1 Tax=Rhizobium leguminosarum TaxID=384 RepID=UPI003D7C2376